MKSELLKRIIKNSPTKNTSILSESVMFQKKDVIPTDVPIINVAFSGDVDGGLSSGLTIFAGPSRNFKSMLALICVKAFLDKYDDGICILYDSEGGITPEYLKTLNIDPTRVVHIPIEHIEMLKFDLVKQLNEITREDKVIILIDSIGNAASLKELEDALSEKSVAEMQRAKSIKGLFRMVTPSLLIKDVPCIAVSHSYSELSLYPKQIISGGCLVEGTKIILADGSTKNIESCNCGDLVMTLSGHKEITHIWNADNLEESEPECFSIEFEDGYIVECSYNHKFLIDNKWVYTKDIHIGNDVTNIKE